MGPLSSEERAAPGPKRSVLSLRDLCDETVMAIPNSDPAPPAPSPDLAKRKALDDLFSATYEELKRLASSVRRHDAGMTLNPTALVNEAWIKLSRTPGVAETSPLHFRRIAARAMRQVLVEAARRRHSLKRGGPDAIFIQFDESIGGADWPSDVLGLDRALAQLAQLDERQARVVECRFFGGMEVAETAEALGISEATVLRDWRAARAWLARELRPPA
jgi:RNA polymerase sigma factor (TIGR02999 family)